MVPWLGHYRSLSLGVDAALRGRRGRRGNGLGLRGRRRSAGFDRPKRPLDRPIQSDGEGRTGQFRLARGRVALPAQAHVAAWEGSARVRAELCRAVAGFEPKRRSHFSFLFSRKGFISYKMDKWLKENKKSDFSCG